MSTFLLFRTDIPMCHNEKEKTIFARLKWFPCIEKFFNILSFASKYVYIMRLCGLQEFHKNFNYDSLNPTSANIFLLDYGKKSHTVYFCCYCGNSEIWTVKDIFCVFIWSTVYLENQNKCSATNSILYKRFYSSCREQYTPLNTLRPFRFEMVIRAELHSSATLTQLYRIWILIGVRHRKMSSKPWMVFGVE